MIRIFQNAFHLAHQIFPQGGTCLEFGVHVGNTYIWQAHEIVKHYPHSSLIGFDSWQGLPVESDGVWFPDRHAQGKYQSPKHVVEQRLRKVTGDKADARFRFVDGFFADSLTPQVQQGIRDVIFINIDVDIHRSTLELLDFILPLLRPGVVLYWDDWKDPTDTHDDDWGEHLAWSQWIAAHPDIRAETLEVNPLNQRSMVITETRSSAKMPLSMSSLRQKAFEIAQAPPRMSIAGAVIAALRS